MRRLVLAYSLQRVGIMLIILAGCIGASKVRAEPCPKGVAGKPSTMPASPCKRWTFDFDSNTPNLYLTKFPNNCDNTYADENGKKILTCYWGGPFSACKAFITSSNPSWKYVKAVKSSGTPEIYRCHYTIPSTRIIFDDYVVKLEPVRFFPYQDHCDIQVNGPYRNCSDAFTLCGTAYTQGQRGFEFTTAQKNEMKKRNRLRNNHKLISDLAGYRFPKSTLPAGEECLKQAADEPALCEEPATPLIENDATKVGERNYHNIHHVIPKKDRQGCACGANSMRNAVIISRQLNASFLNFKRPMDEISAVNAAGNNPYPCSSQIAPSSRSPR